MTGRDDRSRPQQQEGQAERNSQVSDIEISPGDVTLQVGDRINFAAVAYDGNGAPVNGIKFTWGSVDEAAQPEAVIRQTGEFEARTPGKFKIEVEGAGKRAHVKVTVVSTERFKRNLLELPNASKKVSTRDLPPLVPAGLSKRQEGQPRTKRPSGEAMFLKASSTSTAFTSPATAAAPVIPQPEEYGWNGSNYTSADDPDNRIGNPPGATVDNGAGSGNFQLTAPVLSLPGRGIDLALGLAYNSRVWNKAGSTMTFDIDRDEPAPGWALGFGKIINLGAETGALLVEADGTRHGFGGTISYGTLTAHTTDGTFIDYSGRLFTDGSMAEFKAKHPNGTVVIYGAQGQGAVYPTMITDPNGNYLTITYRNNSGPQIDKVVDTLGRAVQFYYDSNNLLTAITAPGLNGGTRTLVRLTYQQQTLDYNFGDMTVRIRSNPVNLIRAIYYPGTNTGYWFGEDDSYSSYGMIAKVREQRAMTFSGAPPVLPSQGTTEPGTITAGTTTQQTAYDYRLTAGGVLSDAPTYENQTVTWEGMTSEAAVTHHKVEKNVSNPAHPGIPSTKTTVTLPNKTKSVQWSFNYTSLAEDNPLKYKDGLVYADETYTETGTIPLMSSKVTWDKGAYESPRPTRTEAKDGEINQTTATELTYGMSYNQVEEARNYGYDGELLRRTVTVYENGYNYTSRHIFNLPLSVEVYADATTSSRVSRTVYEYDNAPLVNLPTDATQYSQAYNPHTTQTVQTNQCQQYQSGCSYTCTYGGYPYVCDSGSYMQCPQVCRQYYDYMCCQVWRRVSVYDSATRYRGNVTKVKHYANASTLDEATANTETRTYDITGNMRTTTTACCEQTSLAYTDATQYAYPESQTRGSATNTAQQITTHATYNVNTGLTINTTDPNGRVSHTDYFSETLRPQKTTAPAGSYTIYAYDDATGTVSETTHTAPNDPYGGDRIASQSVKHLNGAGLVRREEALGAGGVWDVVETKYDKLGRVWQQTLPFRSTLNPNEWQWSETFYDELGRVWKIRAADGSESRQFYNESSRPGGASAAPGQSTRLSDPWGRERWGRTDAQGRLVEVVEPKPDGGGTVSENGHLLTKYSYDALDNLLEIEQGAQRRKFRYDALGRMTLQKLAETGATLNDAGAYVGAGVAGAEWSDAFTYDTRSNLVMRVDARGVKTVFDYNNDPLNRLQSVSYDLSGPRENLLHSPIAAAATIAYEYETTHDVTRLKKVSTKDAATQAVLTTESYLYNDAEKRLSDKTVTLASRSAYPMVTSYLYDTLDRVTDVYYPGKVLATNAQRKVVHHDYDAASRLSGLTVDTASYASQINYNAASQTTSLKIGDGANQLTEKYDYDPATGLLNGQKVFRGSETNGNTLLNLSYDYLRSGTTSGRTGQLTAISDHRNHNKDRGYEYDALGRLKRATAGGAVGSWAQHYLYDRYGNRSNVLSLRSDGFVVNLYQATLNRTPAAAEVEAWNSHLRQAYAQGQAALLAAAKNTVAGLLGSQEYLNRNRSDRDYVSDLYQAYFNRAPDAAGWDGWTAAVATHGRLFVRQAFADSVEFSNHVSGMYPGATAAATSAPAALTVTSAASTQVALSWAAPTGGAAVAQYRVERRQSGSTAYVVVGNAAASATTFTDTTVSGGAAYLYRVLAVDANGNASPTSNVVLGTAMTFSDDALVSGVTTIKAAHLSELRQAVNAVRQLAGLGAATWTDANLSGALIKAVHVQELRDSLNQALADLSVTVTTFTDPALATGAGGTPVRKVHVEELRARATRGQSNSVGGSGGGTVTPVPGDGWASLAYDGATNRITTAGYEYDAAGNQVRTQIGANAFQRFEYDAANRLVKVKTDASAVLASYTYGATNARLVSEEGGARTYYAAEGGQVFAEYAEYGTGSVPQWTKSYVYLSGRLLSTHTPGGTGEVVQFHHPDRLGTRIITNAADTSSFEQATLPFGTALASESSGATNRRFTSYERSNVTRLDYALNRHYDAQLGRFTQVDPIEMDATDFDDPQTLNLYSYCGNDPINGLDPDGLFWGKLWRAIKKVFSNRWVMIAVAVALVVISQGWLGPLTHTFFTSTSAGGFFGIQQVTQYTTLGIINAALKGFVLASEIVNWSWSAVRQRAIGFGASHTVGTVGGSGSAGAGTPDWNPDGNDFIQGRNSRYRRHRPRRGQPGYRGPGSWHYGTGFNTRRPPTPTGYSNSYPRDYSTKNTVNHGATFRQKAEAYLQAFRMMGHGPNVMVQHGKWRSLNGRWQLRAKPGDINQNHIHLERLDPATGRVLHNWHFTWPAGSK